MVIYPVKAVNGYMIYRRQREGQTWIPLYVAYPDRDKYEPGVGEFKTFRQAEAALKRLPPFVSPGKKTRK